MDGLAHLCRVPTALDAVAAEDDSDEAEQGVALEREPGEQRASSGCSGRHSSGIGNHGPIRAALQRVGQPSWIRGHFVDLGSRKSYSLVARPSRHPPPLHPCCVPPASAAAAAASSSQLPGGGVPAFWDFDVIDYEGGGRVARVRNVQEASRGDALELGPADADIVEGGGAVLSAARQRDDGADEACMSFSTSVLKADLQAQLHLAKYLPKLQVDDAVVCIGRMKCSGLVFRPREETLADDDP
ncbi:hypothetical protein HK405_014923 [Cladochytrium tenue]|nr:hypothetical protein HK405_014923 [Cladochytrium tenue]